VPRPLHLAGTMWMRPVVLIVALLAGRSPVDLEKLRLDGEGKVQVDVVVKPAPPPEDGRVDVHFTEGRSSEVVTVVGLNGVSVRRVATATRPLPCGGAEEVTATVVAPESNKGATVKATLRRRCKNRMEDRDEERCCLCAMRHFRHGPMAGVRAGRA